MWLTYKQTMIDAVTKYTIAHINQHVMCKREGTMITSLVILAE